MNKIFICFTCKRDEILLQKHFDACRNVCSTAKVYYIVEPCDNNVVVPKDAFKVISNFPHNGNLIGKQCHQGMLMTMLKLSEINNNADVVKIDSDCFLMGDEWLQQNYDMIGTAPATSYYCKGCCYSISNALIKKVLDYISDSIRYIDNTGRLEDSVITMIAAIVSEPNKVLIMNPIKHNEIISCCFVEKYFNSDINFLKSVKGFIDCGDKCFTNKVEKKLAAMKKIKDIMV